MKKISILGAGAWGTTLAILLSQSNAEVSIWSFEKNIEEEFKQFRENKKYLSGFPLSPKVAITTDVKACLDSSDIVVMAIPTQFIRSTLKTSAKHINKNAVILSASKGIEVATLQRPSQIIKEYVDNPTLIISGPNLAREIAAGLPAASVIASFRKHSKNAKEVQLLFEKCSNFRVYTNDDPIGVELGGALKNVIAIAAGALDQKKLGDNAKSALIVRGISEIMRLGVKMGAKAETFFGLSGLGDLITTCQSSLSRNHSVGARLALGEKLNTIIQSNKDIAEGIPTTKSAMKLSKKYGVEMPITKEVYDVLFKNKNMDKALYDLMNRPQKNEY